MSSGKRRAVDAPSGSGSRPPPQPPTGQNSFSPGTGHNPFMPPTGQDPYLSPTGQYPYVPPTGQNPLMSLTGQHSFTPSAGQHPFIPSTGQQYQPQSASSRPRVSSIAALLNPDPSDPPNTLQSVDNSTEFSDPRMQDQPAWNEDALTSAEACTEGSSDSGTARYGFECPLCGAYFRPKTFNTGGLRKHIRAFHTTTSTQEGASTSSKAIYACGYCCAVFPESEDWVDHIVRRCKVSGEWLVVNQVLGVVRHALPDASDETCTKIQSRMTDVDHASIPESTNFKELLNEMETESSTSEELCAKVVRHLQINQICAHQIMDRAYLVSPHAILCALCYRPSSDTAATALQPLQRGINALTAPGPSETAPKGSLLK